VRGVRAKVTGERGTIQIHREAAPLHLDIGLQHRRAVHQTTDTERRGEKGWRGEERRGEERMARRRNCENQQQGVKSGVYLAFLSCCESQSKPSYRPSPLVAHVAYPTG
jgi:hypothetical protein